MLSQQLNEINLGWNTKMTKTEKIKLNKKIYKNIFLYFHLEIEKNRNRNNNNIINN